MNHAIFKSKWFLPTSIKTRCCKVSTNKNIQFNLVWQSNNDRKKVKTAWKAHFLQDISLAIHDSCIVCAMSAALENYPKFIHIFDIYSRLFCLRVSIIFFLLKQYFVSETNHNLFESFSKWFSCFNRTIHLMSSNKIKVIWSTIKSKTWMLWKTSKWRIRRWKELCKSVIYLIFVLIAWLEIQNHSLSYLSFSAL